jgi:tetratricopeptide (TPR) repeat protein
MNLKKPLFYFHFFLALMLLVMACQQQIQEKTAPLPEPNAIALTKKISYMNDVINDYPDVADYYFRRAVLNLEAKKENLAQKDINQAILLDSTKAEYYFIEAQIHEIREEYKEALVAGLKAESKGFKEIDADMLMGKMSYYAKDYKKAAFYLDKVQEVLPNLAETKYYRGVTYFQTKDTAHAIEYLNQAIILKKDYKEAYKALTDLYNNYGAYKIALRYTQKAIENCGKDASFYFSYGRSLWALRSYDSAVVRYGQAFELDPTMWQAGYQLATYCISKQNYVDAEKYLTKVLVEKPDIERGHYLLAAIYEYHLTRLDDALKHYQSAALVDKQNPQIQMDIRRTTKKIEYEEYRKSPEYMLDFMKRQKEAQLQTEMQKKDSL